MHSSFLQHIAQLYHYHINEIGDGSITMADILFVFPNRRAGLYFKKAYYTVAKRTVFSPETTDINRLTNKLSHLSLANDIELLLILYNSYIEEYSTHHANSLQPYLPFEDFISLGNMMLSDFDEIDKYLTSVEQLFINIEDFNSITAEANFFSEQQIQTIRSIWDTPSVSTSESGSLSFKTKFTSLWSLLLPIYNQFKQRLLKKGIGYQGLLFRKVVEQGVIAQPEDFRYKRIVFIGFNILTPSEKAIFDFFKTQGIADFYFDYPTMFDDKNHVFTDNVARLYHTNLTSYPSLYPYPQPADIRCANIRVHSTPSTVKQSEIAAQIIDNIYHDVKKDVDVLNSTTALLLADESQLSYVLDSLPDYIQHLNITMGYPLSQAPITNLIENVLILQQESQTTRGDISYYHRPLINTLTHPYVQARYPNIAKVIIYNVTRYNYIRIKQSELSAIINDSTCSIEEKEFYTILFTHHSDTDSIINYLQQITKILLVAITELQCDNSDSESFDSEYLIQYQQYLTQLQTMVKEANISINIPTFQLLIARLTQSLKVQFIGEPLNGFQIMGMLESRLLDFDNIIIVGFNDSNVPGTSIVKSLIPYNLRAAYGLPTYELTDAIYAYNFYRTLYRASNVNVIYNSSDKDYSASEISRYYYQIKYLLPIVCPMVQLSEQHYNIAIPSMSDTKIDNTISITKTDDIIAELKKYKEEGGNLMLSASSLKNYIACPLKFFFHSVAHIHDINDVKETDNAPLLGLIFHKAMELYYAPDVNNQSLTIEQLITKAFQEVQKEKKGVELTGFNYLIFNLVTKFVTKTIQFDKQRQLNDPFTDVVSEETINADINGYRVRAIIDRTDITASTKTVNLIDYKTTKHDKKVGNTYNLLELINSPETRNHEIFQILLYCYIYNKTTGIDKSQIKPNIYSVYNIYNTSSSTPFSEQTINIKVPISLVNSEVDTSTINFATLKDEETITIAVNSYDTISTAFEYVLEHLLNEIYDPTIPFCYNLDDTQNKACIFCAYKNLCNIQTYQNNF